MLKEKHIKDIIRSHSQTITTPVVEPDIKVSITTASMGSSVDITEDSTLHSWSGIGLREDHVDDLLRGLIGIA